MENKYYVPTIEEFYVGFECEFKNKMQSSNWETVICDQDMISIVYDRIEHSENYKDEIRVKCLDEQDIQDLGFSKTERKPLREDTESNWRFFEHKHKSDIFISFLPNDNYLIIHGIAENLFKGTIKNKSELKRIMQMLKIIE